MFLVVFVAMLVVMTSSTLSKARSLCCGCCVGVGRFGLKESGNLVLEDGSLLSVDLLLLGISLDGSLLLDFLGSYGLSLGGGLGFGIGLLLLVNAIEGLGFEELLLLLQVVLGLLLLSISLLSGLLQLLLTPHGGGVHSLGYLSGSSHVLIGFLLSLLSELNGIFFLLELFIELSLDCLL